MDRGWISFDSISDFPSSGDERIFYEDLATKTTYVWNSDTLVYEVYKPTPLICYSFASTQWSKTIPNTPLPNGTFINGFSVFDNVVDKVASGTTSYDEYNINASGYVIIPYIGRPYEGQRLNHFIRVNFNLATGSVQTLRLELRRAIDDSVIGSPVQIQRNPDESGQQLVFLTYTSGASDTFVTNGFYVALVNDSGQTINVFGSVGVYIKTFYQKPTLFV